MIYAIIILFMFLIVMTGLVIFLEWYAKHCKKNNAKIVWHTTWLRTAGMFDTCAMISRRWRYGFLG